MRDAELPFPVTLHHFHLISIKQCKKQIADQNPGGGGGGGAS